MTGDMPVEVLTDFFGAMSADLSQAQNVGVDMDLYDRLCRSRTFLSWLVEECSERGLYQEEMDMLKELLDATRDVLRLHRPTPSTLGRIHTSVEFTGHPGKPKINITEEQVELLRDLGFSWTSIAELFAVSRMTLWRRARAWGLRTNKFSNIADDELEDVVRDIHRNHPHSGIRMVQGHLKASGIVVQRVRVAEALRRVDPASCAMRWGLMAHRRKYSVPGPNSLWHIDGHHALIRWRIVTHGGIDGYSRLIVFLAASNNNKAVTVLQLFERAIALYQLPSRVRADMGTENVLVREYMENHPDRGPGRGSFISGRSVHNSRIERLWRDVFYGVVQTYYALFYHLEAYYGLDAGKEHHLAVLHMVYLPKINAALSSFRQAFNSHALRTERNWSPEMLWVHGMAAEHTQSQRAVQDVQHHSSLYGVDPQAPVPDHDDSLEGVHVPECILPEAMENHLPAIRQYYQQCIHTDGSDYNLDTFSVMLEYVDNLLMQ